MKRITLEKVRDCLLTGSGEIQLEKNLMDAARAPLERMIEITRERKSQSCRTRKEIRKGL